jgi:hypothetical protein
MPAQELAQLGHDFLPLRIALRAYLSKGLFDRPDGFAVVAFKNLPQMIRIKRAGRKFLFQHGIEKLTRPRLALEKEFDDERLQFGLSRGYSARNTSASLGSSRCPSAAVAWIRKRAEPTSFERASAKRELFSHLTNGAGDRFLPRSEQS